MQMLVVVARKDRNNNLLKGVEESGEDGIGELDDPA
jgi:hypothetical protein